MTTNPGAQVTATITGQIQGGNLTSTLRIAANGHEYGLRLIDGVTVQGELEFGATVNATITGVAISMAGGTAEVLYNRDWETVVRIPHELLEAA
jgi:hypothetical protein